jgi:hypothetical protein
VTQAIFATRDPTPANFQACKLNELRQPTFQDLSLIIDEPSATELPPSYLPTYSL